MPEQNESNVQPNRPPVEQLVDELQRAFDRLLGRSPMQLSVPVVTVMEASPDGTQCAVELRFRTGERYCCAAPGCSLPTWSRDWWAKFLDALREIGQREPTIAAIEVRGVVEAGAVLHAYRPGNASVSPAGDYVRIDTAPSD